jgi:hypothetical protein
MAHHDAAVHHAGHRTADDEYAETPPGAQYEHTDANAWIIAKFGWWLIVTALLVHVAMGGMYWMMIEQAKDTQPVQYPLASSTEPRLPPAPRLQQFPANEIYDFRVAEQRKLESYGWVDRNAGVVRIPIDEAMRLVVERGLPARAQGGEPAPAPTDLLPADASSGRTMERRR